MRRALAGCSLAAITLVVGLLLAGSAVRSGAVRPPTGVISAGPLTLVGMHWCGQPRPGGPFRPCNSLDPWLLVAIVKWPGVQQWERELVRIEP